jgi:hypothetical protein
VRAVQAAGVAEPPDLLPLRDAITRLHGDAARHEMGVEGVGAIPEVEHDVVAVGAFQRHPDGLASGMIGIPVDRGDDGAVGVLG